MLLKYSVGIDISAADFYVNYVSIDTQQRVKVVASRKFTNTQTGFKQFKKWYTSKQKQKDLLVHFCMEATGVYHEELAYFLHSDNQRVSIVLANLANKYLQSLGNKSKNDPIDAKGLAQMGAERQLKEWNPPAEFYAILRCLTRQHQNLQESKTAIGNQLHAIEASAKQSNLVKRQLKHLIKTFDKQLKVLEKELTKHIDTDRGIRSRVDKVCTIHGVAELTVSIIIAETYGFELFENAKQLISFSGYDVVERQSGKRAGKTNISKKGNSRIRRVLFMAAFNVTRPDQPIFYNLHARLYDKHGIKMKAYVAVQKKLLTTIYALWKKDEAFDPNYQQKLKKIAPHKVELHQIQS